MNEDSEAGWVTSENAYEVWENVTPGGVWPFYVLKKLSADDDAPDARWSCWVTSPFVPKGEGGTVFVRDVKDSPIGTVRRIR